MKYYDLPTTRQELINLGTRIETTNGKSSGREGEHKRKASGSQGSSKPPKRGTKGDRRDTPFKTARENLTKVAEGKEIICYNCNKPSHIKPECRSKGGGAYVRKVGASDAPAGKAKGPAKERR